ncbi:hypothetical protein SAMN05216480_111124 [Pustulibacterium marinum]|uniref:Uncharacterized protein n=1 Tax=Pustulibacterium marinum TaxID=1224947 RepID=A0A1I7HY55_9FLAO|nr:hypothetical protein [Pustulibacterium marinum]SFU65416.1 hypothetical protein SAMN05216480_111124 [Pustulibacterium marinum]
MRRLQTLLTFLIFAAGFPSFGQSVHNDCGTIYDFAATLPQYQNDDKALMDYLITDLDPILSNCYTRDNIISGSIYLILTINKKRKVIDVELKKNSCNRKV